MNVLSPWGHKELEATLVKKCSKFSKPGFNSMWTTNFQMFKLDLERGEEPEIKLPTSTRSSKKQKSSRKTSTFALLTMSKPLNIIGYHWDYLTLCMEEKYGDNNLGYQWVCFALIHEDPEIKLPTSAGSSKKQKSSRKTSTSALLTMPKPLTVWITINSGKFWKRWEYQTTLPASWKTYMQVRKQQLELDMEQQTGSK